MTSSRFRDDLARVLLEARQHGDHRDADAILHLLELLDQGRAEEIPPALNRLRPIYRARIGPPPTRPPEGSILP